MKKTKRVMPSARSEELVVEELPEETLVYDLKRHKAHCLNRTAALVWQHCDGETTRSQMAGILETETGLPRDEGIVGFALDRLHRAKLLEDGTELPGDAPMHSRRDMVRKLAMVGGAMLLPAVSSIVSPQAALAASTTTMGDCWNCIGVGLPCSDRPGRTCKTWRFGRCLCRT